MIRNRHCLIVLVVLVASVSQAVAQTATEPVDWKAACLQMKGCGWTNDTAAGFAIEKYLLGAGPEQRAEVEAVFLDMLRDPATGEYARRFICQHGAYMKSDAAVKVLVDLQADPKFSYSACYGLLQMPNGGVGQALREALGKRTGQSLEEAIQALGALRDGRAVGVLTDQLKSADAKVVRAAVVALGEIGGDGAEAALSGFDAAAAGLKELVAEARLKCAAALGGARAEAIYRSCLEGAAPVRAAAYAGLLGLDPAQRNARLLDAIKGGDGVLKCVAYREARLGGGSGLTKLLGDSLAALPPAEQAILLGVLRDRADAAALPQVLTLAGSPDPAVRCEAYSAIGIIGNVDQAALLVDAAVKETGESQARAREALARLKGDSTDDQLVKLAQAGELPGRKECVVALADRGSAGNASRLMRFADDADAGVRLEAIRGLGVLAGMSEFGELIRRVLNAKVDGELRGYRNALHKVYNRSSEQEKCVDQLLAAIAAAGGRPPAVLLEVLGGLGSKRVLGVLLQELKSPDEEVRKTVLRSMGNWPDAGPVPSLLDIARDSGGGAGKILALRSAVALIARDKQMIPAGKMENTVKMLALADRVDEKRLVVGLLGGIGCVESLALAVDLLGTADLVDEAALAIVALAKQRRDNSIPAARLKAALQKASETKTSPAVGLAVKEQLKGLH